MFTVNQWINWEPLQIPDEKKARKIPFNGVNHVFHTGSIANKDVEVFNGINAQNPANWVDYSTATSRGAVGFVLTENDPYFCVDIDDAAVDGQWSETALQVLNMFPGAYIELSQSGTGLHIFAQGKMPDGFSHKNSALGLEVYDRLRFIAVTGTGATGTVDIDHNAALLAFCSVYMQPSMSVDMSNWTVEPRIDWKGPEDDNTLIEKMLSSRPSINSVLGSVCTISDLWNANQDALIASYPDNKGGYDRSSADAALLSHLAFWTGCDCERMDRLFRLSALVHTSKYLTRPDYVNRTIIKASGMCQNVYKDPRTEPVSPGADLPAEQLSTLPVGIMRQGWQFLTIDQQIEYFKGCVYIQAIHRILTPHGAILKPEQFKAIYGGYEFSMDDQNLKTSKNAFEVFTESRGVTFPKVHRPAFRPEQAAGSILYEEGESLVNTYQPADITSVEGDVTPFLDHCKRILPNDADRAIIMAYMAACVQHIGIKFQWCPIIQGTEGNGKSLLLRVVAYSVGERFSFVPNANDIANKFNGWIENKLFIGVEEIYINDRREMTETLKVMVTNPKLEIQKKGVDQYLGDNRANFMMFSQHKNAVTKTKNDRRYAPFFTAQQSAEDIRRDGMGGRYFPELYKWLNAGGYSHVCDYLRNYDIPDELNPAKLCHRAPNTSSTEEAIAASLGPVEQEIMNAVEEGVQGFRNGWISSIELENLLMKKQKARMVPRNKRTELMESLNYVKIGRTSREVIAEQGRPMLYALKGLPIVDVTSDYMKAQNYSMTMQ